MQTKTIRTPHLVNLVFLFLLALGASFFIGMYQYTEASDISTCDRNFYASFTQEISPSIQKSCKNRFKYLTNYEKRQIQNFQNSLTK